MHQHILIQILQEFLCVYSKDQILRMTFGMKSNADSLWICEKYYIQFQVQIDFDNKHRPHCCQ